MSISETDYVLLRIISFRMLVLINKINNDLEVAHLQSVSSSTWFLVELEFGNVGFWGDGKTGVPGEKPLGAKERTNNKLRSWILDSITWIPDYLPVELGFRIPWAEFRIPKSRSPNSRSKNFPDSRIWITLHVSYLIHPCFVDNGKICWFTVKSHESRVMSPEIISQVARNAELCGSKFYHAQQYPSIPITICRACFAWSKIIERHNYITHLSHLFCC